MTARLVRDVEIVRIAKTAGFDAIYVDLEHSSFSFDTTGQICMMALEAGTVPFVRVPTNWPEYIARALDGGAMGVIAPDVRTVTRRVPSSMRRSFPRWGSVAFRDACHISNSAPSRLPRPSRP